MDNEFWYEISDKIVVKSILDSIDTIEIDILKYYDDKLCFEDYKHNKKTLKSLIQVHNYYTVKDEHLNYKDIMKSLKERHKNV